MKNVQYYTNDIWDLIHDEVEGILTDSEVFIQKWGCDVLPALAKYFYENGIQNEDDSKVVEKCFKELGTFLKISALDIFSGNLKNSHDANYHNSYIVWDILDNNEDAWEDAETILNLMQEDENAKAFLVDLLENMYYESPYETDDIWENEKENAEMMLEDDGFLTNGREVYVFVGYNMGWRHRSGARIETVESLDDLINAVTGDWDYTISICGGDNGKYLSATVFTHDAPTGESYYMIPAKNIKEVMKENSKIAKTIKDIWTENELEEEIDEAV